MSFAALHRNPFLRLLFPFIAGIVCGDELFFRGMDYLPAEWYFSGFLIGFLLLAVLFRLQRYALRWLFGTFLFMYLFVLGAGCMMWQLQAGKKTPGSQEATYRAVITEQPEMKDRSILVEITLTGEFPPGRGLNSKVFTWQNYLPNHLLLYLSRDSLSEQLVRGDELLVCTRFSPPVNNGNPDEFDYARYLARKGIGGVGFANSGYWRHTGHTENLSFRQRALEWRERVLDIYRGLALDQESFAVLSALTVGYKEELGEEIRESYSIAGASHVLALSGLHIGFLYALLFFGLKRLPGQWKGVKLIRAGIIILALWTFAFFTGLSPSVVRSVCMFSLFALAGLAGRESHSLNTLAVTAFFMLLLCPAWLFDVGFQLSFLAVTSILLFYPLLYRLVPVTSRAGRYVWGLTSLSIVAQVGTAPLVLYYFSRFSTHFLLANLLVIPLVSLIIYAAVIMLLLTPFPLLQALAGNCVKGLIVSLNSSVRWVEHLPGASVDGVWIGGFELAGIYLLLYLCFRFFTNRTGIRAVSVLVCLLCLCVFRVADTWISAPRNSLLFYNHRNCPVVHCIASDRDSWLVCVDTLPDTSRLRRMMSRYWNRLRLDRPSEIKAGLFSFGGQRVCILNDNHWRDKASVLPFPIDYLYVCKGFKGTLEELLPLFAVHHVILDASLSDYYRRFYKAECRQLGIRCLSLSDEGSALFLL